MQVVLIDILGFVLVAIGVTLVVRRPARPTAGDEGEARVYVRRIAGTMIGAFGLALSLMVTLFHFTSME